LQELNANEANDVATIQWAAPEVLNETQSVDYILADVYSFGIILWEVLTREQPYYGLSPAAVAVSVIRDQARPPIPQFVPQDYEDLMTSCWHRVRAPPLRGFVFVLWRRPTHLSFFVFVFVLF
jgi:serine/threonine protein kinase